MNRIRVGLELVQECLRVDLRAIGGWIIDDRGMIERLFRDRRGIFHKMFHKKFQSSLGNIEGGFRDSIKIVLNVV